MPMTAFELTYSLEGLIAHRNSCLLLEQVNVYVNRESKLLIILLLVCYRRHASAGYLLGCYFIFALHVVEEDKGDINQNRPLPL